MKKFILIVLACFLLVSVSFAKSVIVRGSFKKSGNYVSPHYKTSPNKTKIDNWSTKGNINPSTGKKGTKRIY
ncbi:MAG: hypothetical protein FD145_1035 [Candidatus Saganbacteria bacterium]|uniref:Uncharacterized protein n=1 Tax=Candidatus Saganbacteria bacterium TaxID=2575572 RepID=A0A833L0J8_UNCSA|nr:MAG: hypothetical protein FD145_1035 [Candidatus Saganbacteria bacterium]